MDLIKSKGMIIFLVILFSITFIGSINVKKHNERHVNEYVYMNEKITSCAR